MLLEERALVEAIVTGDESYVFQYDPQRLVTLFYFYVTSLIICQASYILIFNSLESRCEKFN
jgi:hypothetical protein